MIKKRILVIGINSFPELTGIGKYSGEMVNWLAAHDYEVTMVTAFPYYPQWKIQEPYSGWWYRKESPVAGLTFYRCPLYVPARPTGLKRMIHEATFFLSAFFMVFRLLFTTRYATVIAIAPPFHLGFLALFYRWFKKTPVLYHLQDLQIDAARDLGVLKADWFFSVLFNLEKYILKKADQVTTISKGMQGKVLNKAGRSVSLFPNWADTDIFYPLKDRHAIKHKWGFLPEDKILMYSGSIGEKQGLEMLLDVAAKLDHHRQIKFVICGTGPFKDRLVSLAEGLGLKNVFFFPLQDRLVFNEFLNMGDIHLVLQKANAGDLVMPSKLTTILSIGGLVIVTADRETTLSEVITENQMGIVISPENAAELEAAIVHSVENEHSVLRTNARLYAERNLSKEVIFNDLAAHL